MAYAPTTWDANDVITKDKLNKIEQGINTASKLSGTDIDADKNWNGRNITNLGYIAATRIRPEASDEVRWGPKQYIWNGGWSPTLSLQVVIPSIYIEGTAKLTLRGHPYWDGDYYSYQQVGIKVNGVSVAQWSSSDKTLHEYVYLIKGGDVIVFWSAAVWGEGGGISDATVQLSDTAPIIYPEPPTWPE